MSLWVNQIGPKIVIAFVLQTKSSLFKFNIIDVLVTHVDNHLLFFEAEFLIFNFQSILSGNYIVELKFTILDGHFLVHIRAFQYNLSIKVLLIVFI